MGWRFRTSAEAACVCAVIFLASGLSSCVDPEPYLGLRALEGDREIGRRVELAYRGTGIIRIEAEGGDVRFPGRGYASVHCVEVSTDAYETVVLTVGANSDLLLYASIYLVGEDAEECPDGLPAASTSLRIDSGASDAATMGDVGTVEAGGAASDDAGSVQQADAAEAGQ